uniref:NADH dehydrogenase [ubiquinone] iron-sulfur protein 6, mitochondrial n=1 Tax=Rhabditophanes sp. KR3021 TaxID=114890 RepID=A0AC35U1A0_9BILA
MNRLVSRNIFRVAQTAQRFKETKAGVPAPIDIDKSNAVFDKQTHTGQAWDHADYRLQRFHTAEKQVNPNVGMDLIAQVPSTPCEDSVISCNGGHDVLGHPKVYINLDKPGHHACGYCGLRFHNVHVTKEEHKDVNYLNC